MTTIKKDAILSETSFFVVQEVRGTDVYVVDDLGNNLKISQNYVDKIMNSADRFSSEEKKSMTELADLLISNPRVAMTVAFMKKDVAKTKKAYDAEVAAAITKATTAKVKDLAAVVQNLIENPINKVIPGELRVMKGRHYGEIDDLGRVQFVDMELPATDSAHRIRQIDPRTIKWLIVKNVKYSLK